MNWRNTLTIFAMTCLTVGAQTPKRMIDRCAQDGRYFWNPEKNETVTVDSDDVELGIRPILEKEGSVVLSFTHKGHTLIEKQDGFAAARGWLVVSPSAFAVTWNLNASAAYVQLFDIAPSGEITENTSLVQAAERQFVADAKRFCRNPGVNTAAIKWIDDDRLLLSVDAWSSYSCQSNFTEGFILKVTENRIERKLTERELINLPAICTWNIVPVSRK